MSTQVLPLRKFVTAASRAAWLWSAWIASTRAFSYISSLHNSFARSFVATNTSTGGFRPPASIWRSSSSLPFSCTDRRRGGPADVAAAAAGA